MKKSTLILLILPAVFLGFLVAAYCQEDMRFVNTDAFENPQRPRTIFNHEAHNEKAAIDECNECHHVYDEQGNLVEDESSEDEHCSDCHDLKGEGRRPGLMQAFHTNCKGCHEKDNKGPVMCGQCHVRNPVIEG
jgi:hypothetical protein